MKMYLFLTISNGIAALLNVAVVAASIITGNYGSLFLLNVFCIFLSSYFCFDSWDKLRDEKRAKQRQYQGRQW
jgi:hypothetical protein